MYGSFSEIVGEEKGRRLFLLRVVLIGVVFLSLVAAVVNLVATIQDPIDEMFPIMLAVVFWFLYFITLKGFLKFPVFLVIGIISFLSYFLVCRWGTQLPQSWILLALTIVMGGILIGSLFSFILVVIHAFVLVLINGLQNSGIIAYQNWDTSPSYGSIFVAIFTFSVIAIISWLSNREIEKALKRARKSESELKKQRDNLEIEVQKRTKELRKKQLEKIIDLYKFADFGRLTAGLFHDIANPLTQVSLNLSNIRCKTGIDGLSPELKKIDPIVKRAISGTEQMQRLILSVRKQIQQQETKSVYSLRYEIKAVMENFEYKARGLNVSVNLIGGKKVRTFGNPMRFYQLISNILSNALDSYYGFNKKNNKKIIIDLRQKQKTIILKIEDFGCGIDPKIIEKIFDPMFTTKDLHRGTGVGLYISKTIVEKEFGGKITVKSKLNEGTSFTVKFPIREKPNEN